MQSLYNAITSCGAMRYSAILIFAFAARCISGAVLSIPNQLASPGQTIQATLSFSSEGSSVGAIQFDIEWDSGIGVQTAVKSSVRESTKRLYNSAPAQSVMRCLVVGVNQNVLPDGELLQVFLTVAPNTQTGVKQVRIARAMAVSVDGTNVSIPPVSMTIQIQNDVPPSIESNAVLNSASLSPGPVSPGEIVTLLGSMGTNSLLFSGITATVLYAGGNQVNAIVPFGLDPGKPASLELRIEGQSIATVSLPVSATAPAIFTQSATGVGPGAILNQDFTLNTFGNPAARDSIIIVYGTGFGTLTPPAIDGQIAVDPSSTTVPVFATIGGIPAEVTYAGSAPGLISGATQINVRIPKDLPANLFTPISLSIGSVPTPPGVTVSIR